MATSPLGASGTRATGDRKPSFAVTAPSVGWSNRRVIVSRHETLKAAEKALRKYRAPDAKIEEIAR